MVARLTGELVNRSEVVNVRLLLTREYLELRNALVRALTPFPDVRRAVAACCINSKERPLIGPRSPYYKASPIQGRRRRVSTR